MIRRFGAVLTAVLVLTSCGGNESQDTATGDATTPSATPSETTEPTTETPSASPVVVSLETTCGLFFGDLEKDDPGVMAIDLANKKSYNTDDLAKMTDLADTIEGISERAQPELRPYLDAQSTILSAFVADIEAGGGGTHDMQDFKAAGLELLNQCKPYLLSR